jgi:hypothetical protein
MSDHQTVAKRVAYKILDQLQKDALQGYMVQYAMTDSMIRA